MYKKYQSTKKLLFLPEKRNFNCYILNLPNVFYLLNDKEKNSAQKV